MLKVALLGNPNCGKTTLFNALTGDDQYVGNWAGVTVEKKEGYMRNKGIVITDLPGVYSLSPFSPEEMVARDYLINEKPDIILNIIDGTNIERSLYLTTQLTEIGIPIILAINMMDVVRRNKDIINFDEISKYFGVEVCEISALKGVGLDKIVELIFKLSKQNKKCFNAHHFTNDVENAINRIEKELPDSISDYEKRFFAVKLFEKDKGIKTNLDPNSPIHIIIKETEAKFHHDSARIIAEERYKYIASVIDFCVTKNLEKKHITDYIDKVIINPYFSFPILFIIMFFVYYVSISVVGKFTVQFFNQFVFGESGFVSTGFTKILTDLNCANWIISLVVDGIIAGVGSVVSFVPQLFSLFFFLSILEDSGYMSRIAFILDEPLRKFGLSGKSFIPILLGTGCGVTGIMASRTIENEKSRRLTIMTTTFIPCSAKIPVIALIASNVLSNSPLVAPFAYFIGIFSILFSGIVLKKTSMFQDLGSNFIMELPKYHFPKAENVLKSVCDRGFDFVKKAGTIIFLASCIIWALSNLGMYKNNFGFVSNMENSILSIIGQKVAFFFKPLGFGLWQFSVATITGLFAKEGIVSTLEVLGVNLKELLTKSGGISFLIFNLLCIPCIASVGAIFKEMKSLKWSLFALLYETGFAYIVSFIAYYVSKLIIGN